MIDGLPLFLIVIPTYKRELLLRETVDSVFAQSYKNWRMIISDSGNTLTPDKINKWSLNSETKIELWQYGKELNADYHWHLLIEKIKDNSADFCLLLGDDDILAPSCLEVVAQNSGAGVIGCNTARYFSAESVFAYSNYVGPEVIDIKFFDLVNHNVKKHGLRLIGYNESGVFIPNIETHVSAYFIPLNILRSVVKKHGALWVRPFVDVGIGLAIAEYGELRLLTQPLVIIRRHESWGMALIKKDRLRLVENTKYEFQSIFPGVICFNVFSALSYRNLLIKVCSGIDIAPGPFFYAICIRQIVADGFLKKKNAIDLIKILSHAATHIGWLKYLYLDIRKAAHKLKNHRERFDECIPCINMAEAIAIISKWNWKSVRK